MRHLRPPPADQVGINADTSYPQPFPDGKRVLWGTNVIDCGKYNLTDARCTPTQTHIYPIHWSGNMRELRLNPDGVHLGWNRILFNPVLGEVGYFGRLSFDVATSSYGLTSVTGLYNFTDPNLQNWTVNGSLITFNPSVPSVGRVPVSARTARKCTTSEIRWSPTTSTSSRPA